MGCAALFADPNDACLRRGACLAGKHEALGELLIDLGGGRALDRHHVDLTEALARVGYLVDKISVVGEKDQPLRVGIETSGGLECHAGKINQIGDLVFGMGIGDRRDVADGFVQGDVVPLAWFWERLAVNEDLVGLGVHEDPLLGGRLPVDSDAARCDESLRASA